MKIISQNANCSTPYTNHCLRAMGVTILDEAGYPSRDIMAVSGHKSEGSIKHYARTSVAQKSRMSDTLSSALLGADLDLGLENTMVNRSLDPGPEQEVQQPVPVVPVTCVILLVLVLLVVEVRTLIYLK